MSQVENTGVFGTTEFDAWPTINEEIAPEIISGVVEGSAALQLFRRLPNMAARTLRQPVLDTLGAGSFVEGTVNDNLVTGADAQMDDDRQKDYGPPETEFPSLKSTHQFAWKNVFINAEAIAINLPIPEDVMADSSYDLQREMMPRIIEAFDEAIDNAIIWGQGRPSTWPSGIVPTAISRGYTIDETAGVDFADAVSQLMALLEADGKDPTAFMCDPTVKATLRGLRDNQNMPIFNSPLTAGTPPTLYGLPLSYVKNGSFQPGVSRLITGAMNEARFSVREDLRIKIITEGVITDADNNIVFNLPQQDMIAIRVVMRLGWAVPNSIHALAPDRAASWPFAVLNFAT